MLGGDFIAVIVTGETTTARGSLPNNTGVSVTYDGQTLSNTGLLALQGAQFSSISYLQAPTASSGDVLVELDQNRAQLAISVVSLSGVASVNSTATFSSTSQTSETFGPYSGTADGFMVMGSIGNASGAPTLSGDNFSTYLTQLDDTLRLTGVSGVGGLAQGYGSIAADGAAFTETINYGANSSRNVGSLLSLNAVPEPGSLSFLAVATFGLATVRRRKP